MEIVASGLGGYQHGWTRARAVFCRVVVGKNFELLNGIDRGQNRDAAGSEFVIVIAIQQPVRTLGTRSTHGKGISSTGRNFATCTAIEEAVRVGLLCCARR